MGEIEQSPCCASLDTTTRGRYKQKINPQLIESMSIKALGQPKRAYGAGLIRCFQMPPKTSGAKFIMYAAGLPKLIYIDSEMIYDCVKYIVT